MVDDTTTQQTLETVDVSSIQINAAEATSDSVPPNWSGACELFVKQLFTNRFIWLVFACALYINLQLTYIQWNTARHISQQFDTLDLIGHLLVVVEAATLAILMIGFGAVSRSIRHWRERFKQAKFPYFAYACALQLVAGLLMLLSLLILVYPHSYPQLRSEGISVPLMLFQRALLVFFVLSISTQIAWLVRMYTRLPWKLTAIFIAACQIGLGYLLATLSLQYDTFLRLNSVFYYGYLWRYIPEFPNLQHANLFHNIQMPYFGIYAGAGVALSLILTSLWLPRAAQVARRETRNIRTDSSS